MSWVFSLKTQRHVEGFALLKTPKIKPKIKITQFYKLLWVDATGFEPATHALQRHCSTN